MYIGVDYYPEHWPRTRWEHDAVLMRKAGFNVVRLAEFAWVFMEPREGRFEFGWLDDALAILGRQGISAILGTPTAAMPAWVALRYPNTLATQKDGRRITWGTRKNNCFTDARYRMLSRRITRAMARHFAATPNVIGWQTDNEFGTPMCYCNGCQRGFKDWLAARYKTPQTLNRAWGTHFWGQRVGDWREIAIPQDAGTYNPSACLDWQRFFSWLNVRFQREQVEILRRCCPRHFVTHNFMGLFAELDYYDLARDLDHVSWDNYPVWGKVEVSYDAAAAADLMRGLKKKNFWVMEQTAGPGGWFTFARSPRPGEMRKVFLQQMAHGADAQLWFRWRTSTAGREQYWHGLLGHDGKPLRRYREAARIAGELRKLSAHSDGTTVKAPVAIIYDFDSIWALRISPGFEHNNYHDAMRRYYRALFRAGINVDMIKATDDFAAHRVVVAPQIYVLSDTTARRLSDFVARGGVLVTDCRTGVKDQTNLCHERTLPGLLSKALGIVIEEYEGLSADIEYPLTGSAFKGNYTASRYADWITIKGAEALLTYTPRHMRQFAAVTRHRFAKGWGYHVGSVIKEEAFYDALISDVLKTARVRAVVTPAAGVEVSVRQGRGRKLVFLINHTEEKKTVRVPPGKQELLSGRKTEGMLTLPGFGCAVVKV